ncbi:2Fe-2S iron-sulfur cluster-binding protein [Vibrio owensii]|uniref:2Fe-2S iron-sulfur cluster-binding protein n=1 Tax=Vibrio owensii TaxID=696485 RepID=UPI0018F1E7AC|nr:2Fe-2S iron-sulfur cluster binding domain-containing protein [Vibrio owensii]
MSVKIKPTAGNETILEALEELGYAPPFQCREGICGACLCKKISGDVEHHDGVLAYVDDDSVLLCAAKALTEVEVTFLGAE